MLFTKVSIRSIAHIEAPISVSSAEISARLEQTLKRVKLPLNLLERMTGIKARRFWSGDKQPSDVATEVAEKVIQKSGLAKSDIGAIISTSISKDFLEPSIASIIHGNLKLTPECLNFDVGSACLGFLAGMQVAANMIESGMLQHVLIVSGEAVHKDLEVTLARLEKTNAQAEEVRNQMASLTIGSGGVAMILSHTADSKKGHRIQSISSQAATEHARLCCGWFGYMETDAPELIKHGIANTIKAVELAERSLGLNLNTFDEFVFHQVSKVYVNSCIKAMDLDKQKVYLTYPTLGNMASASLPYTLSMLETEGRLIPGKRIALIGAGSGLNAMVITIHW